MLDAEVKRIVVAGGDAASAAAAAALAISLRGSGTTITLLTDGGGCDRDGSVNGATDFSVQLFTEVN